MSALNPECAWARVVKSPSAAAPMPAASSAARGGPFFFPRSSALTACGNSLSLTGGFVAMVVISSPPFSRDRGHLVYEGAEDAGHAGRGERDHEESEGRSAQAVLARELRAVVDDDEGDGRRDDRREPGDVLLPLHAEGVPLGLGGIREEQRARAGRGGRAVPGVHDPRAGEDREPGDDRHEPRADPEAGEPLLDAGHGDQVGPEAVEAGEAAGEREQEQRSEDHPVDDRPGLPLAELHGFSFLSAARLRRDGTLRTPCRRCGGPTSRTRRDMVLKTVAVVHLPIGADPCQRSSPAWRGGAPRRAAPPPFRRADYACRNAMRRLPSHPRAAMPRAAVAASAGAAFVLVAGAGAGAAVAAGARVGAIVAIADACGTVFARPETSSWVVPVPLPTIVVQANTSPAMSMRPVSVARSPFGNALVGTSARYATAGRPLYVVLSTLAIARSPWFPSMVSFTVPGSVKPSALIASARSTTTPSPCSAVIDWMKVRHFASAVIPSASVRRSVNARIGRHISMTSADRVLRSVQRTGRRGSR